MARMPNNPTIGSFIIIKNERPWIAPHLQSWLPYLDEMVFYDGGSTDGTLDVLRWFSKYHPDGDKIKVFENKDPKNLQDDYVRLFNECLHELSTDLAAFIHPDMYLVDPGNIRNLRGGISYTMNLRSFAGDPDGKLYEIVDGRSQLWKNIYTLKPDFGLHYHGHYGASDEDCYYSAITGDKHEFHGHDVHLYPYAVADSGIKAFHYSDVRPYARRLGRMISVLKNNGYSDDDARERALNHPRVVLKDGEGFKFVPTDYTKGFVEANKLVEMTHAAS